ncbi:hypothetical protein ACQY1X_21595 [Microcystis protocystis FBCC-A270]|uniref:hypothetical protein n=1 Tax=Microcystis protocystis TaxID=629747 RepID=UPI003D2C5770
MSTRSFAAFLNEVKSDETLARDLKSALVSVNVNDLSAVVAEFAHRKGMALDAEALLESLQASMNIASAPEFSDREIEYIHGSIAMETQMGSTLGCYTCGDEIQCRDTSFASTCD